MIKPTPLHHMNESCMFCIANMLIRFSLTYCLPAHFHSSILYHYSVAPESSSHGMRIPGP